jgi:hypothetical protein
MSKKRILMKTSRVCEKSTLYPLFYNEIISYEPLPDMPLSKIVLDNMEQLTKEEEKCLDS